jgi:23S rRNA pseudouridine2605 synthase
MDDKAPREGERIAKVIARAGRASRREAERLIAEGRVAVNGETLASPALNVGASDIVTVDGVPLDAPERVRLFKFHKPMGCIVAANDPRGRKTIYDILSRDLPRVMPIGRLDYNSEGLLLLTNDGGLKRHLELPRTGWIRRYRARAHGDPPKAEALAALAGGVTVDGIVYGPIEASVDRRQGHNCWLTVALREGRNREVRRVLAHLGLQVNRLIRTAYGPFLLGELAAGDCEEISARVLREQLGTAYADVKERTVR